jgi:PAS domain S-box-containing protein
VTARAVNRRSLTPAQPPEQQSSEHSENECFRDIAETLPVVLAVANADLSQFLFVNRAYEALWGKTVESLYANPLSCVEAVHPEDQPALRKAIDGLVQGRPVEGVECRLPQPDGSMRWVLCRGRPVRNGSGQIVRLVGISEDITEQKRVENSLRESEDRYRDLVEHSSDLLCTHDLQGNLLSVNEAPLKILGYTREELFSKPLRGFVTEEAKPLCDLYLKQIQKTGFAKGLLPVVTKTGDVRLWEYSNSLRQEGVSSPIVRGLAHDVTEQKRMETALRKSEEKFSKAFHASPVDMIITSLDTGQILDANERVARSTGLTREQLIGRSSVELGMWFDPADRAAIVEEMLQNGRVTKREKAFRSPSGKTVFRLFSAEPIRLNDLPCMLVISEDVTERKKAEQDVRQLSSRLLRLHDQEHRNIARELHDSTGQDLVALSALLVQLQDEIPSTRRKSHKIVSQALAVAERCIRDVRTLSYVLYPPMLEETGLRDAISHYVKTYSRRTSIEVALEISPRFGRLSRDVELALFRVAQESLTNIQRHSGSYVAKVCLKRTPAMVCLEVSDKGRGISGFDPKCPETHLLGCGGVGLYSMAERLKQVGGKFEMESSSSGTTIRGVIPIHEKETGNDTHTSCR